MKWAEISRSWVPCPCGSGIVVTVREADEHRHIRLRSTLECEICEIRNLQSLNEESAEQQNRKKELQWIHEQMKRIFSQRYKQYWKDHFAFCSSKRAVWEILCEAGLFGKSLSAFYEELRNEHLPYYLDELPNPNNMHLILQLLEIEDNELLDLLQQKRAIEKDLN